MSVHSVNWRVVIAFAGGESADSVGLMRVQAPNGGEWSFICMFGAFDMPFEVTISELAIELLFPADRTTADAFKSLARERRER